MIHVSMGNSKIGKVANLSTLPTDSTLTKLDGTALTTTAGTCRGCCANCKNACYAVSSAKRYPTARAAWEENTKELYKDPQRFFDMLAEYIQSYNDNPRRKNKITVFRYHVSGEFISAEQVAQMGALAERFPDIIFYGYTKQYEMIEQYLNSHSKPNNYIINVSIWHNNYKNPYSLPAFVYDDGADETAAHMVHCPAVDKNGRKTGITCAQCKRCMSGKPNQKTAVYAH